jgi:hypothetical protein
MVPRGVVAVDVSKAINIGGSLYFSAPSSTELNDQVERTVAAFVKRNRANLTGDLHHRISAVLVYLRTPAVIENEGGLLTNFRRSFVLPSLCNDGKNKIVFQRMQEALSAE